jgi:hypothetical protein
VPFLADVDWSTVGVLALVVLLDGLRKVPAEALILRSVLGGPWYPVEFSGVWRGWRIVSLWPPLSRHLVVLSPRVTPPDPADVAGRLHALGWATPALTALGWLSLGAPVLGIPIATARFGGWGLVVGVATAELVAVVSALISFWALRRLHFPRSAAARRAAVLLSPFTAPRAVELVLEAAVEDLQPVAVLRALLSDVAFDAWLRPRAYDALQGITDPMLRADLAREPLAVLVSTPPPGVSGRYCPRCGHSYRDDAARCIGCEGVGLVGG